MIEKKKHLSIHKSKYDIDEYKNMRIYLTLIIVADVLFLAHSFEHGLTKLAFVAHFGYTYYSAIILYRFGYRGALGTLLVVLAILLPPFIYIFLMVILTSNIMALKNIIKKNANKFESHAKSNINDMNK